MKTSILYLILTTILCLSCIQEKENTDFADIDFDSETYIEEVKNEIENFEPQKTKKPQAASIKAYKVMSQKFGIPVGSMPIPASWKVIENKKENVLFESEEGVKVYGEQFASFYFSNNQEQNYYAQQGGSKIKPIKSIDRVINEDLKPFLESKGLKYLGQFALPQLAQFDTRFDSYLFKSSPEQRQYQCVVTEWEDGKGNKSAGIIRYFIAQYTTLGGVDWGYTVNAMEARERVYETAKKDFINSLVNFQINPKWVQTNNQYYAQLTQQSSAGHQQRMAALKAQGQAIINNGNTYSSIIDSNHESWKRRNGMQDAGHANNINSGIWERNTVSNPNTGQQYQVEGHNNYYYGNGNNEYIGTNDALYNPNIDNSMNHQNWTQLEIED
jgi:hypothetical protein